MATLPELIHDAAEPGEGMSIALCGDVMTGRGIDQILPHPGNPALQEIFVRDARDYVRLAESAHGAVPSPVGFDYIWGDALPELRRADVRIINLETSVTTSDECWRAKGIHYRMHPRNIGCLTAAGIDVCGLANNHVLDRGYAGLAETLSTLRDARLAVAGAGRNAAEAAAPAVIDVPAKGRVLVLALGSPTSGIPREWAATGTRAGINLLTDLSPESARGLARSLRQLSRPGDVSVVSLHWGENWGYAIPREHVEFAHALADAGISVVHGHSSHHAKAIELRHQTLILHGCGDFLNDYEGIDGNESYRGNLTLLYQAKFAPRSRAVAEVRLVPLRIEHLRSNHAPAADARWLCDLLHRESARFGTDVRLEPDNTMTVRAADR